MSDKSMEEFDPIWLFVEKTYNIEVPSYIKNILHACGFNNGITIASIDDEDMQYFVDETRNGNVMKCFDGIEVDNVLKGANIPAAEFNFTRGHKKLLWVIVQYLKKYMEKDGSNNFIWKASPKKKTPKVTKTPVLKAPHAPRKILFSNNPHPQGRSLDLFIENHHEFPNADLKIHEGILLCKVIMSLINFSPELYCKNSELIKGNISNDLVMVYIAEDENAKGTKVKPKKETWAYYAVIRCPYCGKTINDFQTSSVMWVTTNFDRHLKLVHPSPSQNVNSDGGTAAIPTNTTENIENDNTEASIAGASIEIDDYSEIKELLEKKSKKKLKNPSDKITERIADIPPHVNSNAVTTSGGTPETKIKKQLKKPLNQENKDTQLKSKSKSVKTTESIPLDEQLIVKQIQSIVCYYSSEEDDSGDDKVQQEHELHSGTLIPSPTIIANHYKRNEAAKKVDLSSLKNGDYVICSSSIKSSIKWPANKPLVKNFVGQVCQLREHTRNEKTMEEIELQFLKKSPYSKLIFKYPEKMDISYVPRNEIVKILKYPSQNRRGELVFEDKFLLDYTF